MSEERSAVEMILDPECIEDIVLYDSEGKENVFSQAAVIPLEGKIYVILVPVTPIEGVGEGEGITFVIEEIDDEDCLVVVQDEEIIDRVFEEYDALFEEEEDGE